MAQPLPGVHRSSTLRRALSTDAPRHQNRSKRTPMNQSYTNPTVRRAQAHLRSAICAAAIAIPALLYGQATSTAEQSSAAPGTPVPSNDQVNKTPSNDVSTLSPFIVNDTQDQGYLANNTLAGSRLNTPL